MATGGNGSDEIVNSKCYICAKKNITTECQEYYCTPCTDLHKLFPFTVSSHQILGKSDFGPVDINTSLPSFPVERCTVHKSKLLDIFCEDHDEIVCATCASLNHRTCQSIYSVPDEVENLYTKAAEETNKYLADTEATIDVKQCLLKELNKYKEQTIDSIKDFRKEIETVLNKVESESIREVKEEYRKVKAVLEEEIKEAKRYLNDLRVSSDKLNMSTGNKAQGFVLFKIAMKNTLKAKYEVNKQTVFDVEIGFIPDSKVSAIFQELKTFGTVFGAATSYRPKNTVYTVKEKKQLNVRHKNDRTTCNIHGSCFTEDGFLLLADHENKTLKRVDPLSGSIKDCLDLYCSPNDVCQTYQLEAAVSMKQCVIQFVSLGDKVATTKKLNLDHECYGLTYNKGKLFITDRSSVVYVHEMNGGILRKITQGPLDNPVFSKTQHICLSSDRRRLCVADERKGLVILDLTGNYESVCIDTNIGMPRGVCSDMRGNAFACGWSQSEIVQINENTKEKVGVLGKVTNSLSACFDPQRNKLAITLFDNDNVEVYELE